jgi:hypothetical protein
MRLNLPFRVARGITVVLSIVLAHAVILWLFNNMRIRMPDLGPVFATLMVDPEAASHASPPGPAAAAPAPTLFLEPPMQAPSRNDQRSPAEERQADQRK